MSASAMSVHTLLNWFCQKHNHQSATWNNKWSKSMENLRKRPQSNRKKMLKYADETTLYSKALKSDITALENTGCNRLISIPDNGM